jgi:hypothetical protein
LLKEEYYFPSADGGTVQKESCRGKVGADNKLTFGWDGVSAIFTIRKFGDPLSFGVTFKIEQGASVVWSAPKVIIKTELGINELSFDPFKKIVSYGDDFKTASYPLGTLLKMIQKKKLRAIFSL